MISVHQRLSLAIEEWQTIRWNFIDVISTSKFLVAFATQKDTVIGYTQNAVVNGFTPSYEKSPLISAIKCKRIKFFSTFRTNRFLFRVFGLLSAPCFSFNIVHQVQSFFHNKLSPKYTWSDNNEECSYWYKSDGKWVGIFVIKLDHLYLLPFIPIRLKHPSYRISFSPNADISKSYDVLEQPTLKKAKKLAEWYYKEWLKVNNNNMLGGA